MRLTLGVRTTSGVTAEPSWEILTGATPGRVRLIELGIFLASAVTTTIGFGRPQAIGVTPTSPVDFLPEDGDDVIASGVVQSALAWGTKPTIPANFIRRISLPATVGTGVIWTFPMGIVIPVSSSLILWNLDTNAVCDCYAVVDI
jgi:hypothetical protein